MFNALQYPVHTFLLLLSVCINLQDSFPQNAGKIPLVHIESVLCLCGPCRNMQDTDQSPALCPFSLPLSALKTVKTELDNLFPCSYSSICKSIPFDSQGQFMQSMHFTACVSRAHIQYLNQPQQRGNFFSSHYCQTASCYETKEVFVSCQLEGIMRCLP